MLEGVEMLDSANKEAVFPRLDTFTLTVICVKFPTAVFKFFVFSLSSSGPNDVNEEEFNNIRNST